MANLLASEASILSTDPNERILARRLRIQRRRECANTKSSTSTFTSITSVSSVLVKEDVKLKLNFSQKQVDTSMQILDKLIRDGIQLTSNVEKAVDARELEWRAKEKAVVAERMARLELEAKAGQERFLEVEKAWESLLKHKVPHVLYKKLMEQKQACFALVEEKNNLIEHLKNELEEKENAFVENIRKQADDVKIIIERMNEHASLMKTAYQGELEAMELAFMQERRDILKSHQEKWNDTLKNMNTKEDGYVETRRNLIEECQEELDNQWKEDAQEYNAVKSKMEIDIMQLELEFQTLKTKVLMNQEKLEYNYHTLKKRDEENSVMKSNQKRRLTKMNDTMANLKRKYRDLEKQCSDETQKLSEDYKKIVNQLLNLERKYTLFQKVDISKYRDIWKMNEMEMKRVVIRLIKLDKIIHEQYLAIPWIDPNLNFMQNVGPWGKFALNPQGIFTEKVQLHVPKDRSKESKVESLLKGVAKKLEGDEKIDEADESTALSLKAAQSMSAVKTLLTAPTSTTCLITTPKQTSIRRSVIGTTQPIFNQSVLRKITMLLCDQAGFLLEDRVLKILNNISKTEKNLIKVSSIFNALSIYSEEEMQLLAQYFVRYTVPEDPIKASEGGLQRPVQEPSTSKDQPKSEKVVRKSHRFSFVYAEQLSENDALSAIRDFVSEHRKVTTVVEKVPTLFCQQLIRNKENDNKYWNLYLESIPQEHIRLWKALIPALEKYHTTLVQRGKLYTELKCLRTQHSELQNILNRYLRAKINHELKLPPIPVRIVTHSPPVEETRKNAQAQCNTLPRLSPRKIQIATPNIDQAQPTVPNQYLNL